MPSLDWIGKDKVVTHHLDVQVHELLHSYGFTAGGRRKAPTGSGNMIIHGDNLIALKSLLPEYEGRVDFIFPADYSEGTALDTTVKHIIQKMAIADLLWEENVQQLRGISGDVLPNQVGLF